MPLWATTWPASISRTPRFLGTLEPDSAAIAERAHAHGALAVVGVDATSLGVLEAPPRYGADLVCGELQGLGIHMHYGGGTIGFIASADDERIVAEYPTFLVGGGPHRRRRMGLRRGALGPHGVRAAR